MTNLKLVSILTKSLIADVSFHRRYSDIRY